MCKKSLKRFAWSCFCVLCISACSENDKFAISPLEAFPGGVGSTEFSSIPSFEIPVSNLPSHLRSEFYAGKALAGQPWVIAPSSTNARDGLGPLFNARSCLVCHKNGGRGKTPSKPDEQLFGTVVRVSVPGVDEINGVVPEPSYGDQLQTQSIAFSHQLNIPFDARKNKKEVAPEAYIYINWKSKEIAYPDGQKLALRFPELDIKNLAYGKLAEDSLIGIRNAPPLIGVGLLELIEQSAIDKNIDEMDDNNDGISGRLNWVWNRELNRTVPGRFGLKANRHDLRDITAAAFLNDIGISSHLYPIENCTPAQIRCQRAKSGNDSDGVELSDDLLKLTTNYVRNLGVPKRRNEHEDEVRDGRDQFYTVGCTACHTPSFKTASFEKIGLGEVSLEGHNLEENGPEENGPEENGLGKNNVTEENHNSDSDFRIDKNNLNAHLFNQTIWPYSDLLLHDMGPELADNRPDFKATGSEWRTPPLWGIGLSLKVNGSNNFLHDGRAKSVEEAIVWHGGEAEQTRNKFMLLPVNKRTALIKFVESL